MTYQIRGTHQITRSRGTVANVRVLWDILSDSRLLPQWVPAVHGVEHCEIGGEAVGALRHCSVELGGRRGKMIEECVDLVPRASITYAVRSDTLGLAKMFSDYCFRISLRADGTRTMVAIDTYYTPKNVIYKLMNALIMRRQFRVVVDNILQGLCRLAERQMGEAAATRGAL
jgi:hypothetical protein